MVFHLMFTWRLRLLYVATVEWFAVDLYIDRALTLKYRSSGLCRSVQPERGGWMPALIRAEYGEPGGVA